MNASGPSLSHQYVAGHLSTAIHQSACPPELLEIEISESFETYNLELGLSEVTMIRGLGVSLSLDDYGTAYSSLKMLAQMPLNKLKIDRSLVNDIGKDAKADALVTATIGLAKLLGYTSIAEGVGTKQQAEFLRETGCHGVQGFLYGRPVPAEEFENLSLNDTVKRMHVL